MAYDITKHEWDHSHLEIAEWDNVWSDTATDMSRPRAFFIGDSISCGYRNKFRDIYGEEIRMGGFGSSKAIDNPILVPLIETYLKNEGRLDYVFFNNGLHPGGLDADQYEAFLRPAVAAIIKAIPETAKFFIVLTTPTQEENSEGWIRERNVRALKIAEEFGVEVVDLFSLMYPHPELWRDDRVHLLDDGYKLCAETIYNTIKNSDK